MSDTETSLILQQLGELKEGQARLSLEISALRKQIAAVAEVIALIEIAKGS